MLRIITGRLPIDHHQIGADIRSPNVILKLWDRSITLSESQLARLSP